MTGISISDNLWSGSFQTSTGVSADPLGRRMAESFQGRGPEGDANISFRGEDEAGFCLSGFRSASSADECERSCMGISLADVHWRYRFCIWWLWGSTDSESARVMGAAVLQKMDMKSFMLIRDSVAQRRTCQ